MVENSQIESSIAEIRKRNGKVTNFDKNKISNAIHKALMATNQDDRDLAEELTNGVPVSYTHLTLPTILLL